MQKGCSDEFGSPNIAEEVLGSIDPNEYGRFLTRTLFWSPSANNAPLCTHPFCNASGLLAVFLGSAALVFWGFTLSDFRHLTSGI